MFGDNKNNSDEIGKLWERLVPLERDNIKQKNLIESQAEQIKELQLKVKQPSDSKAEAQSALRSISQHKSKIVKVKDEVLESQSIIVASQADIEIIKEKFETLLLSASDSYEKFIIIESSIAQKIESVDSLKLKIEEDVGILLSLIEDNPDLESKVDKAKEQIEEINESESKSESLLKTIASNHMKVKELRDEIFGYEVEDEDGAVQKVDGLKSQLDISYNSLEESLENYKDEYEDFVNRNKKDYESLLNDSKNKTETFFKNYKQKYDDTFTEIAKLLPKALTAGLSHAYDEKVETESDYLGSYKKTFSNAILGLVAISLIPFAIDVYLLLGLNKELLQVLADTPKLIISILPLYLPVLWIAYSANKKQNLSKRLIEEYTHKGVLSKTFEGLQKQINELDDGISEELRVKLLFNLLHVNSENPGKLISDYNTTDHPLMDALDKSSRLGDAIDKLNNIPGFSKIVSSLEKRQKNVILEENKKVSEVIEKAVKDELP
jgi:hypothetical protein